MKKCSKYYFLKNHFDKLGLFNEDYYLNCNPDVKDAVSKGIYTCGFEHYVLFGESEGRNVSASRKIVLEDRVVKVGKEIIDF